MEKPDAGLRDLDHYKTRLPTWRYKPRQFIMPLVRWETPYLAAFQNAVRTPSLDSYFAITANLGTHTFFTIVLPILFWCGYTGLGRAMVHILASGVIFSSFLKDLLCMPRPLSPPLHRITMSGSTALEYGFPSTHSMNAVSVTVYALLSLHDPASTMSSTAKLLLQILCYSYATSIVVGRLYCGMHGFLDVVVGSILGAALSVIQYVFIDRFDAFILHGSLQAISIFVLMVFVLVRIHPEPADDCPCFDDSVAFAGVICGVEVGTWHFAQTIYAWDQPVRGTVPYTLVEVGWMKTVGRILLGVFAIFAWREIMKPALLKGLPPVFRVIERLGLSLPRKFFKRASEYDKVPGQLQTDNVMPSVSKVSEIITSIRHPRRNRSVSIGPQSAADAYETLAFRQRRRKESLTGTGNSSGTDQKSFNSKDVSEKSEERPPARNSLPTPGPISLPTPLSSDVNLPASNLDANECAVQSPLTPNDSNLSLFGISRTPSQDRRQNEKEEREIFSHIEKPRARYDVEVITKIIVYAGIGWIAVEGSPIIFHHVGLGMLNP